MTVYLVGAGPGDPGLLTVRGQALVKACDALVYDRLVDDRIVALAGEGCERHYAGKRPGGHSMTQEAINAVLLDLGGRHETVVRLKGGDPFIFGRGGEEALALHEAGIAFEVVPGISSAYAVPAYAGIPVTQRGMAAQVTFVTGHEDPTKPESDLDWASLASTPGTLVFLMGVGAMERNALRLIEHGMPADTRAAVISHGTRPGQRTVVAPLSGLAQAAAGVRPPAIMLVGAVAALHEQLDWFERRPLHGRRVLVTRARAQASGLAARLEALGAEVVQAPAIRIEPLPFDRPAMERYETVVVTSANGVDLLLPDDVRALHGVKVAAIGPATAQALRDRGIVADVLPPEAVSESLLAALGDVGGQRVLVATAEGARDVLPDGLRGRGAHVDVVHLYRTVPEPVDAEAVRSADLVTFTSSSTVQSLAAALGDAGLDGMRAASIGPVTSAALRKHGIEPAAEADPHTVEGLVAAVERLLARVAP
jgi:uroporphyrinogen III methyltransferase / synthase